MAAPWSYLLCGTPRTGSSLLCSLLASTGVAGFPESYFREPDQRMWAERFGVPIAQDGTFDYRAFVAGAVKAGTTSNGVFGARVMWGTMHLIVTGLSCQSNLRRDIDILTAAFGPLRLLHLQRDDIVGQAVSWARAEQTGYWQQGDVASPAHLDLDRIDELVETISQHNAAWCSWFTEQGREPYAVWYEDLVADPDRTVRAILDHLDVEPRAGWIPESGHRRQADEVNASWVHRYRRARGGLTGRISRDIRAPY